MPVAIDATAGGATANSFVLLSEAATYMAGRLNSTLWDNATTDSQNRALVSATNDLNTLAWEGRRATTVQALQWPRWSALNPDSPVGFLYASDIVPDRVKNATCELAFQYLVGGTTDVAAIDPTFGVIRKKVDVLETQWQPYQKPQGLARFPSVMRFIRPLLSSVANSTPILRG